MPPINNRPISDITFLDSLNGYAVTGDFTAGDTNYVLKTTNGGDNWMILFSVYRDLSKVKFINTNTGFICGGFNASCAYLAKTTDGGLNWFSMSAPCNLHNNDMAVLSENTIWLVDQNSFDGGVYRTTNGGASWDRQINLGSQNPDHIYMFNGRIGFISETNNYIRKTTNGGQNWDTIVNGESFRDIYFVDSLKGWRAFGNNIMYKSTDGGMSWAVQSLPSGGLISSFSGMSRFTNINKDTIWGGGGYLNYGGGRTRGLLYNTTNGGDSWRFQLPDTSFGIPAYEFVDFTNKLFGWGYESYFSMQQGSIITTGIHTTTGGNDTFYTSVTHISSKIPDIFYLGQNYPNPFNPVTYINYELRITNYVILRIFDITGKHIIDLVNEKQPAGSYKVTFDGTNYSSGVYFYLLIVDGKLVDTKKMILLK